MGDGDRREVEKLADEIIGDDVAKSGDEGRPGKQPKTTALKERLTQKRVAVPAAVIGAAAVALVAVALTGGFGGGSSAPTSFASSAPLVRGGDDAQRFVYWEGHATSYSGCASPGKTGASATTNYAGNMWMDKGVLYASGVEFSGNFKGELHSDGTFEVATPVTPGYASSFRGHITPHGNTGLFNGTFTNRVAGDCFVHGVMSGHVALTNDGFGGGARIATAKP